MAVSLHGLIDERFGVRTRVATNREDVNIDTTNNLVLRNDSTRLAFSIVNLGQQSVWLLNASNPTAALHFLVGPNGGTLTAVWDEDFSMVGQEWRGQTPSGTTTLFTQEILVEPDA